MKTTLIATLLGLALPMGGLAEAAPTKPAKPAETDALQKAIEAVNRGVEKSKPAEEPVPKAEKVDEPTKPPAQKPVPARPAPPSASERAKPRPVKSEPSQPSQPSTTRITSEEDAEFQNKEGLIFYRKNVLVDRPDLKIWSDELQISLNQQTKKPGPPTAEPPPPKKPADDSDGFSANNVKEVLTKSAPGGFVVIWRKTEQGEIVAMAREAVYVAATGNITLKGSPDALRDLKLHVASEGVDDQLILMKNGSVKGGKHTGVVPENEARDIRRRILSHAPVRRGGPPAGGPSSVAVPPAIPSIKQ